MPKIVKINENQLKLIVNYIKETENKKFIGILNENFEPTIIEEGWKDVVLGTAMLLGLNLTGQNKVLAQDATNNQQIMAQIKSTLESNKIKDVANDLEKAGLKNALEKIEQNARSMERKFNEIAKDKNYKYRLDSTKITDIEDLKSKIATGHYAVKDVGSAEEKQPKAPQKTVQVLDTADFSFGSDKFFETANFKISDGGIDSIKSIINGIKEANGKILEITIESSTDTEPIKITNEKLADLRANSIKDVLTQLGVEDSAINKKELPNQGPMLYTHQMSKEERDKARKETAKYRYDKISIKALYDSTYEDPAQKPIPELKHRYELVRIVTNNNSTSKIPIGLHFPDKRPTCKSSTGCPNFK